MTSLFVAERPRFRCCSRVQDRNAITKRKAKQMSLPDKPWYVYVMQSKVGTEVYTGATNRPKHRAEAHNGTRAGGARTTARWGKGNAEMIMLIGPFPGVTTLDSKCAALSFEKKMKVTRSGSRGVRGRVLVLYRLLWSPGGQVTQKLTLKESINVRCKMSQRRFLAHAMTAKRKQPSLPPLGMFEWDLPALP